MAIDDYPLPVNPLDHAPEPKKPPNARRGWPMRLLRRVTSHEAEPPALGGFEPADATRLAKLAEAVRSPFNHVLTDAIRSGAVNTKTAKTALDHVDRIVDVLPPLPADTDQPPMRDQVFGFFLLLPPGSGSRAVRELRTAQFGTPVRSAPPTRPP